MAKNPVTGLEEDNKIETFETPDVIETTSNQASGFSNSDSPVVLDDAWQLSTGFTPLETQQTNQDFTQEESKFINTLNDFKLPEQKETTTIKEVDTWITGIWQVDNELLKLREDKQNKINETIDQYNLEKWVFEDRKNDYKNFDVVNTKFENVLKDLRDLQSESWTSLNDEQIQNIAIKNWLTTDQIKNPTSIFNELELTEDWRQNNRITSTQNKIDKINTDFERAKEDLEFQLEWQLQRIDNDISDTRRKLAENVAWAKASWAWAWASRSSWYERGIQNIKDEWKRVISRLQTAKDRLNRANETNIKRLTENYELAQKQAKDTLDRQLESVKFNTWLELNWLETKYWTSSTELTNALNKISEEFWTKSLKVFDDYLWSMQKINQLTNQNIEREEKFNNLVEQKMDKRFNELINNNWLLLSNTNLNELVDLTNAWELTPQRFDDLKNIMLSSINKTLSQRGNVDESNLNTIESLLDKWFTPTQVISRMGQLDKFKNISTDNEFTKLSENRIFNKNTWEVIDVTTWESINQTWGWDIDFTNNSELIRRYPNEASFKNNNPAGITYGITPRSQWLLEYAGISFELWTARPSAEWGNYIRFSTVEDGINAQKILLSQAWTDDIYNRLKQWVWTAEWDNYATQLMNEAWLTRWDKFSEISNGQLDTLVAVQMRKESPNFYKELINQSQSQETNQSDKILWSLGVPIAFERQIKQMVPTQLQNSEVELAALNDTIKRMSQAWFSTDDAVLTYMGFDINKPENKQKALDFVDIARTLGSEVPEDFIPKVSNFINNWEDKKAMTLTERVAKKAMSNDLWAEFVPENVARTWIERSQELLDLVDKLEATWQEPLWEFEWTFQEWLWRFKGKEAQKVATQAERLVAQFRTDLIGTAGTQTENNNIANLIPQLWDDIENFRIKVSDIWDESLRELNNQREEYGLPPLSLETLKNKDKRLKLYTEKKVEPQDLIKTWQNSALSQTQIAKQVLEEMQQQKEQNEFNSLY